MQQHTQRAVKIVPERGNERAQERTPEPLVEPALARMKDFMDNPGGPLAGVGDDFGEVLRHELNNPLTGILGNAELLLARRERFSALDTQRLQTVVDLAVRLRETIRRLTNSWDNRPPSLKSA